MKDIEIAEQEFKSLWREESKTLQMTEEQLAVYKMHVHHGFLRGFMKALDRVAGLLSKREDSQ